MSSTSQKTASETERRNNTDEMGASGAFQNVTAKFCYVSETEQKIDVTFQKCEKPPTNGHCYGVTDENAVLDGEEKNGQKCAQCGRDGAEIEAYYGDASARLHRGACEDAWRAACDVDDLSIPSYLDRRPGAQA